VPLLLNKQSAKLLLGCLLACAAFHFATVVYGAALLADLLLSTL
jgi:hypothetical protein